MAILFQVLRRFFYSFTIIMGVLLIRGDIILGPQLFNNIKEVLMPGYLVFCGVMIGYLIAVLWKGKAFLAGEGQTEQQSIFNKSFIVGIVIGIALAICYIIL